MFWADLQLTAFANNQKVFFSPQTAPTPQFKNFQNKVLGDRNGVLNKNGFLSTQSITMTLGPTHRSRTQIISFRLNDEVSDLRFFCCCPERLVGGSRCYLGELSFFVYDKTPN